MKKCTKCGGELSFSSAKQQLVCTNCDSEILIDSDKSVEKIDLEKQKEIEKKEQNKTEEGVVFHCGSCGADSHFDKHLISEKCSFCGSNLITENKLTFNYPDNIVPFKISKEQSRQIFKKWINKIWFAPNALKRLVNSMNEVKGCYVPFWSFDSNSKATYSGERGDYYYETQTRIVNGKEEQYKNQKTMWKSVSGDVKYSFKNKLELAQTILPESLVDDLDTWDFEKAKKFNKEYTLGYQSLFSNVSVDTAWKKFVKFANQVIEREIKSNIGGDEQKIYQKEVKLFDNKSIQVSLPIWIGTYQFNKKTYRICINGENGKIDAERPYSIFKITALIILIILFGGILTLLSDPESVNHFKNWWIN